MTNLIGNVVIFKKGEMFYIGKLEDIKENTYIFSKILVLLPNPQGIAFAPVGFPAQTGQGLTVMPVLDDTIKDKEYVYVNSVDMIYLASDKIKVDFDRAVLDLEARKLGITIEKNIPNNKIIDIVPNK